MTESKMMRLGQIAAKLNIGTSTIIAFLKSKGHEVENNPNTRISSDQQNLLTKEFQASIATKKEASDLHFGKTHNEKIVIEANDQKNKTTSNSQEEKEIFIKSNPLQKEDTKKREDIDMRGNRLQGTKVVGHVDLNALNKGSKTPPKDTKDVAKTPTTEEGKTSSSSNSNRRRRRRDRKRREERENAAALLPNNDTAPVVIKEESVVKEVVVKQQEPPLELIEAKAEKLQGLTVLGKIELPDDKKKKSTKPVPVASSDDNKVGKRKRKRKRNRKPEGTETKPATDATKTAETKPQTSTQSGSGNNQNRERRDNNNNNNRNSTSPNTGQNNNRNTNTNTNNSGGTANNANNNNSNNNNRNNDPNKRRTTNNNNQRPAPVANKPPDEKEIQEQIKNTLARLSGANKSGNKQQNRRQKKDRILARKQEALLKEEQEASVLKVTEFISANELANLMGVSVNEVISKCLSMGMFVSINHRLDADAITVIADEFSYNVEFISAEQEVEIDIEQGDNPEYTVGRPPIVTIMGHVDHGKTSLLDYIRKSKVTEQEAGGITQHIGAYSVKTKSGKQITFLDTPGHEAFTAMRARGAKVTDVAIIVIAADDNVMPQTKEAINHAQLAGVPIVFAFNKIDKADANPEKLKEELAGMNLLVEDWGGKYQSQEISAKKGIGIEELLEKVLLEAEMLELKADPTKRAIGTVVEAKLDKGRGYVTTVLVQGGTLRKGDIILAGANHGRVKAMNDDIGKIIKEAPPSTPIQVLGLDGAPQAGDKFHVLSTEKEAREIAAKRSQLIREQSIRTTIRTTLSDIGRRIALGSFKQLNIILKGDVDGSIEALADSLLRLSTEEVEVRIIQKAVGQITESDVLLAAASDAVIIGFQVRPSVSARKLAETEHVELRLYSIIYNAINEVKAAMEGMLSPTIEEVITGSAEVRDVFKISKVGTVAGSYVLEGHIKRNAKIRLIRDGIVVYGKEHEGELLALKRFKDDVSEVKQSFECGISIKNFNDLKTGDIIEAYEQKEIKRKL